MGYYQRQRLKILTEVYKIFIKNCNTKVFYSTYLLCLPVSDDNRVQGFINEYVNMDYIKYKDKMYE